MNGRVQVNWRQAGVNLLVTSTADKTPAFFSVKYFVFFSAG
jgi:hypothetical protein